MNVWRWCLCQKYSVCSRFVAKILKNRETGHIPVSGHWFKDSSLILRQFDHLNGTTLALSEQSHQWSSAVAGNQTIITITSVASRLWPHVCGHVKLDILCLYRQRLIVFYSEGSVSTCGECFWTLQVSNTDNKDESAVHCHESPLILQNNSVLVQFKVLDSIISDKIKAQ